VLCLRRSLVSGSRRTWSYWRYVYWAVDQHGQVIDVFVSRRSNVAAATKFFELMLAGRERPTDVTTDLAAPLLRVVDDLLLEVLHDTTQYANSRIECEPWTASTACGRCEVCERIALRRR
jgi:transposase-like protein